MEASRGFEGEPSKMSLCKSFIGQLGRGFLFIIISYHLNTHFFLFFVYGCGHLNKTAVNTKKSIRFPLARKAKTKWLLIMKLHNLASAFVCSISLSNKTLFVGTE